jgi:site-specific recombinase XerD
MITMLDFKHKVIEEYLKNQRTKKAEGTYRNRQSGLAKFEKYLDKIDKQIDDFNGRDADSFTTWLVADDDEEDEDEDEGGGEGLHSTTAYEYLTAVRLFYDWYLLDPDVSFENPARQINPKWMDREPQNPKPTLEPDEVRALVESAQTDRATALLSLLATTGMRIREATLVETDQIDWDERKIEELTTVKNDFGDRTVYFSRKTRRHLKTYIDGTRGKFASGNDSPYLFVSADYGQYGDDNKLSVDRARVDFIQVVKNCDEIQDKVTYKQTADGKTRCSVGSHIMRRSYAQHWVDSDGSLVDLRNQVGWESLDTALEYLSDEVEKEMTDRYGLDL